MDFEALMDKYLAGQCTDEEKKQVEDEIERARMINEKLIEREPAPFAAPPESLIKKASRRFNFKLIIKTVCISLAALIVITGITLGTIFTIAVRAAKSSVVYSISEAEPYAVDYLYEYVTQNAGFTGARSDIFVQNSDNDFEMQSPLSNSYYDYEFKLTAGGSEYKIDVDSRTAECRIVKLDREFKEKDHHEED